MITDDDITNLPGDESSGSDPKPANNEEMYKVGDGHGPIMGHLS